jgi:Uma2 family endonuclease
MTALPKAKMTVDEFLAWSATVPGRHELVNGEIFAMSPDRVGHTRMKFSAQIALRDAIGRAGVPCHMLPDGATVRIEQRPAYEPDALVYCGPRLDDDLVEVPNPVIVVEVLSPGTKGHDTGEKLVGYFRLPSVQHYLILDPVQKLVIHHRRGAEMIETRIAGEGLLSLDPPGLKVTVGALFAED